MRVKTGCLFLIILAAALGGPGCGAVRNINFYSTSEEVQLGQALSKEISKQYPLLDDDKVNAFLQARGERLVAVSSRPDLKYHFTAVNDDVVNAFAIPGGFCYIHLGLIRNTKSEAELISVVAHELSHVTNRHGVKRLSQMQIVDAASQIALGNAGALSNTVANLFTTSGLLYYSREDERQADHDGLIVMYKAGYDPEGMVQMFEMLKSKQEGPEPKGWQNLFSTHPITTERIDNAKKLIAELPPKESLVMDTPEWDEFRKYIDSKYPAPKKETKSDSTGAVKKLR